MKLPSFSKLELADLCQFPWTSGIRYRDQTSPEAAFGKAAHKMAECIAVWGDAPVGDIADSLKLDQQTHEKLIAAYVELTDRLNYEAHFDQWRTTEWCFGFQLKTGEVREIDFSRRWRRRRAEVVGVIDLLRIDEEGRLRVRDYKTGYGARFTSPLDSLQLQCYGMAAARFFKKDSVIVELAALGSELYFDTAEMDEFLLDWAWDELHRIQALVNHANNVPKPGVHCKEMYCPIVDQCPATKKALVAINEASELVMPLEVNIVSDDHARYIYQRLPALRAALKNVEQALRERYEHDELKLANGKVLKHWEEKRDNMVLTDEAMKILDKHLGGQADDIVERKVSKTAMRAMCKEVAPERGATRLYKAIWADLERAGLVNTSVHTKFEARKVKS